MNVTGMAQAVKLIRYLVVCFSFLVPVAVYGQAKFSTVIDQSTISRDQLVQVEYVVENAKKVDDFDPPSFRNFVVVQGPIQSSGMTFVNGNLTQYKALVFLLQPKITGRLIIPGATATIDGKRRQSDAVAIEVTKSKGQGNVTQRRLRMNMPTPNVEADREFVLYPNENVVEKIKKNLFVRVEVNKKSCYVNEPVVATYKLYSRLRSESRIVKRPSYNGFSVYDMVDPESDNPTVETLNGKQYNVHIIRKSQLFPLQAGRYTLEPVEVENTVHFIKAPTEQDTYLEEIPDPFAETVDQTLTIGSEPLDITVKPLPATNQPAGFDGAVGNFSVETSLKDPITKAGESSALIVKVKGKGNIPMINAPSVTWPKNMEVYDPTAREEVHPETAPLAGEKTFEYLFTPKDTGKVVIPGIRFSFFDPVSQSYKTDSTGAIALRILPGNKKRTARKPAGDNEAPASYPAADRIGWWIAGGALVTLLVIGLVVMRNRKNKPVAAAPVKPQPAAMPVIPVTKPNPLEKARRMLSASNSAIFIKEVESVTWNEVSEQLNIPPVALNQPQVVAILQSRGADEDTIDLFKQLMHDLEYSLYIPGQSNEDLRSILNKAESFLNRLNVLS
jgi:hypothetical protein